MVQYRENLLDAVFGALSDPTRRAMIASLAGGEATITTLAAPFDMSFAGASKHVRMLERAGLVTREKRGREHFFRLEADRLKAARTWLDRYEAFWTGSFDTLEAMLLEEGEADREKGESDER